MVNSAGALVPLLTERCLQLVLEHRALHPKELPPPPNAVASSSTSAGNNSSNTNQDTASITNVSSTPNRKSHHDSLFAFDFGSLMGRDSSKSPKYPEKMLKVLDGTLQRVAMGQEPRWVMDPVSLGYLESRVARAASSRDAKGATADTTDTLTSASAAPLPFSGLPPGPKRRFNASAASPARSKT